MRTARAIRSGCAGAAIALALCLPSTAADAPVYHFEGEEQPVRLWPILGSERLPSGAWRKYFFILGHSTRLPSGQLHSLHVLNYVQGPNHRALVPLWFQGRDYNCVPSLATVMKTA